MIPILGTHPEGGHLIKGTLYNTISVRGVDLFFDYLPFLLFYFFSIPGKSDEKQLESYSLCKSAFIVVFLLLLLFLYPHSPSTSRLSKNKCFLCPYKRGVHVSIFLKLRLSD